MPDGGPNPLSRAIGLLGDEWTLLLLRHALAGSTRYSDFNAQLPISNAVLTNRLDTMVCESLMERRVYQRNPVRSEYLLTVRGRSTWPLLVVIWAWERKWVPEHAYATPPMIHQVCGREMSPLYCCTACKEPVTAADLHTRWGPSGGWSRSVPEVTTRRRSDSRGGGKGPRFFYPDTMAVFGNRWSSAVVGAAFLGAHRFSDFQSLLGIPPSLLAERLASLCDRGILEQVEGEVRPAWKAYRLTGKGLGFFPVVAITVEWAQRWYTSPEGRVLDWTHAACGAPFIGTLACDRCRKPLTGSDIDLSTID
ncbi:helix-turn-helix domain-containing protein [Actinocorallia libanotica]|uniref:Helix-turn-helix domain-containing protein n=1 Tax=Actinocorallia libanotica TaxID=46162 RepID=A0ABP4BW26_9ACTN